MRPRTYINKSISRSKRTRAIWTRLLHSILSSSPMPSLARESDDVRGQLACANRNTVSSICFFNTLEPTDWELAILIGFIFFFLVKFSEDASGTRQSSTTVRGLGTDVALVSSMVFLAQFILSSSMGSIVSAAGSTTAVVVSAAVLSFCGSISASQVMYLDL